MLVDFSDFISTLFLLQEHKCTQPNKFYLPQSEAEYSYYFLIVPCLTNMGWLSGERIMDYMNMDERSVGMFWVVSYTMAQPACETVMNWLTSAGVTEIPGPNLQPNERLMVMQEVSPLPISLLSGFSINLCLKLAYQMEESMFSGQVKQCPHYFLLVSIFKWAGINLNLLRMVRTSFENESV